MRPILADVWLKAPHPRLALLAMANPCRLLSVASKLVPGLVTAIFLPQALGISPGGPDRPRELYEISAENQKTVGTDRGVDSMFVFLDFGGACQFPPDPPGFTWGWESPPHQPPGKLIALFF